MSRTARYALVCLLFVFLTGASSWPWLDGAGRAGVTLAAAVALPVQVIAFGLLLRLRRRRNAFLAAWVGGTLARMGLVFVLALVLLRVPELAPAPTLLALVGFLFGMLLLEPLFFWRAVQEDETNVDA